jgi:hypothetical protein
MEDAETADWGGGWYDTDWIWLILGSIQDLIFDEFITGRVTV